jgi:RimJ/RimL family protein N-acetyltransferase
LRERARLALTRAGSSWYNGSMTDSDFVARPLTLSGRHVRLEPLARDHLDGLFAAGSFDEIWKWLSVWPQGRDGFAQWVEAALAAQEAGTELPFTTFECDTNEIVGSTRYLNIDRPSRRLEIGWTWITPARQRSVVNTEAKYLQLQHCFEELGCRRVELKTDARNEKSRNAMLRIGAQFEGIARKQTLTRGGSNRDNAWFAFIDDDWPAVKVRLEAMLANRPA